VVKVIDGRDVDYREACSRARAVLERHGALTGEVPDEKVMRLAEIIGEAIRDMIYGDALRRRVVIVNEYTLTEALLAEALSGVSWADVGWHYFTAARRAADLATQETAT